MFRLELFVEDKNLAKALRAVQGIALMQSTPQPVVNAKKRGDSLVAESGGTQKEMILKAIEGRQKVYRKDLVPVVTNAGGSPKSINNVIDTLIKDGTLRRSKVRGVYLRGKVSKKG